MIDKLIFWAQALDNSSPDHIVKRGVELSLDDTVQKQEAVSMVSSVVKVGAQVFCQSGVQLTADDRHFVVEVPSEQRDREGRIAPIVCYGDYDSTMINTLGDSVVVGLSGFAKQIGRNILPEHIELTRKSFVALKKKSSKRMLLRVIGIGAAALFLLSLLYWLILII